MSDKTVRILFVCNGNTCRSPMAAAMAAARMGSTAEVQSVGIESGSDAKATQDAVRVMSERGLDISNHRSSEIDDVDITAFDIVVAMSPAIAQRVEQLNPKRLVRWSVSDPHGCGVEAYRAAADAIETSLEGLNL